MFVLGHLGIGSTLVRPFTKKLSRRAVLLGTILPDLVDKPVYYALSFATGKRGLELGFYSGTRTFGHTLIFVMALGFIAISRKSRLFAALMLGVASHLFLDNFLDQVTFHDGEGLKALFWPFLGWQFPVYPFSGATDHLRRIFHPAILWGEIAGAALLAWDYWRIKNQSQFLRDIFKRRLKLKRLRKKP